jgi:hypothetical protein
MCQKNVEYGVHEAVPQHRRLVAGFLPRSPGVAPRAVHVAFVVDKEAVGQVFLRDLGFSPVNIIPPLLHIDSCVVWVMDNGPVRGRSSTET